MSRIKISEYIVEHLMNLGIKHVFGLPGDYNFNLIEAIEQTEGIEWIGCTNELNAGYSADGYARVNGYGAIITTYGVGELSAMNAIAGSYAESVPVIKIVGVPKTADIYKNSTIHHNFATPNYFAFKNAYENIVDTTAYLDMNEEEAKKEIDRVFSALINEKKPVYIAVPVDVCNMEVNNEIELDIEISDMDNLNSVVWHIKQLLSKAQKPVIIADILAKRFNAMAEVKAFVEQSGYPVTTLLMGKGIINDDCKNFIGIYNGRHNNKITYEYVNSSDCPICVGAIFSDLNTFGFDIKFNPEDYIQIMGNYTVVEGKKYSNVLMKDVLSRITEIIDRKEISIQKDIPYFNREADSESDLNYEYIYNRIQNFLKEDDIIFTETGLTQFGFAPIKLPKNASVHNQVLWGSIGWATPAAFGGAMAEKNKRVILLTGEGSHQLTATEIASMLRYNVKPIIIVFNNNGYTIERVLSKDPMDLYNDISSWNYSKLIEVFKGKAISIQVKTSAEFDEALKTAQSEQQNNLCYIEVFTQEMDMPFLCKKIFEKYQVKI